MSDLFFSRAYHHLYPLADDVILKKYAIKPWKDITFQQLINYPFVALSVKCQDIHFMRSIEPDYKRYISFSNDVPVTHNEEFIHYMTPMHFEQPGKSEVFSYEFVEAYFTRYVELAKSIYGVSASIFFFVDLEHRLVLL